MGHPLDSALAKISRARDHLEELQLQTRTFTEANSPSYAVELDDDGVGHVRFDRVPTFPVALSLVVGDVVHNIRSALDHLVYQLAAKNHGTGETNAFPIFEEPAKYRDSENRLLRDVIPDDRARIAALQPYNLVFDLATRAVPSELEANFWLMILARLDNLDKHRLLLASSAVAPLRSPRFRGVRFVRGRWAGEGAWVAVEEGAELFTIDEIVPIDDPSKVKMDPEPVYTIRFGDGAPEELWGDRTKGAVTAADLLLAADAVERVIASFSDAF